MKKNYLLILFFVTHLIMGQTPTGNSAEVGITEGQLSVSLTGGANYSIPIAVPPGINGVVPQVGLIYNSQGGNGLAGYGWNLSGVSTITRIPRTKFHDGVIGGVNFDANDRFAFDGQRLMIKSGTSGAYGANLTVYETENFSNVKITSMGVSPLGANYGPAYFKVEYPDGSKAYYGNSADSLSLTDWAITYWENPQGVRISYNYILANNNLSIEYIKYGSITTATPLNQIKFVYIASQRSEQAYVGGQSFLRNTILSAIQVSGNGVGFRNYLLAYNSSSEHYQQLTRITESSGDNTKSYNPTVFVYNITGDSLYYSPNAPQLSVGNISSLNAGTVSGDFDGDGNMDFLLYPTTGTDAKSKYWLFSGISPNISSQTVPNMGVLQSIGKFEEIFPVSWLSWNNKLMPMQGWNVVQTDVTTNSTTFNTYSTGTTSPIYFQYNKQYTFPKLIYYSEHPLSCIQTRPPFQHVDDIPKSYISGDFNGDGLTDIVAVERNFDYSYLGPCDINNEPINITDTYSGDAYFVNLDRRITSNYVNIAGKMNVTDTSKLKVADFNGDGKSDIYVFDNGNVKIYSLNDSNQFVPLFQTTTTDPNIVLNNPILMGDYNGDGKSDFMIPKGAGFSDWYRYISTGTGFNKETVSYPVVYPANDSYNSYNFIPTDYDNDGKTDLLIANSTRNTANTGGYVGIECLTQTSTSPNTFFQMTTSSSLASDIDIYALPIFLPSTDKIHPHLEIAFINNNKLYYFNSSKNTKKDRLINTITTGNGVKETVTYQPLDPTYVNNYSPIYTSSIETENYPYFDIVASPDFQIVTKLEKQSPSVYKRQLFGYFGAVSNVEGLGFLGFRSMMRTNWHNDTTATAIISSVSKSDVSLRGANTENYQMPYLLYPSSSATPTDFISKSVLTYNTAVDALQANKVFKLQNTSSQTFNSLDNTSSQTTTVYDAYNNPTQATTTVSNGATVEQTTVSNVGYAAVTASPYVVGRPTSKTQSVTVSGDATTSNELYAYTNNLLSQVKKIENGTTDFITEDNTYDTFGNITKKTITAPAVAPNPAPAPRTTNYEYDPSGRFLTKSTDIEGLSTTFAYNSNNGILNSETNPYGLTTSYLYDPWFKKIKTTDYLGNSNTYTYTRTGNVNTLVTTTGDDGSFSSELFDDLGRKMTASVKNISGNNSSVDYKYDIYDRT
ncbi:FG-GAP-like repeat-containing protein, partial [Flavobacterium sp. UBA6046]|uniref:FG-GAP-like repeat-containing protein n=1 Tax=Flavobacterium sp. UBA6046 TaxID=1946552 RepID=UPI0025BFC127